MRLFSPYRYVSSIDLVDIDDLVASGVRALLIDRDNTLVPRDADHAPAAVATWLEEARSRGIRLCMVSNNWHEDEVSRSASELGMEYIHFAMKPAPFAIWRGLRKLGATADEALLIGDQLYTDVWSGALAGVRTILVRPQTHVDMWYTHIFRIFERRALRGLPCEGVDLP